MRSFIKSFIYAIIILYTLVVLTVSIIFLISMLDSTFQFDLRLYIFIPLILVMICLGIDYFSKKDKTQIEKMSFILYLFFIPCVFPLLSVLIFAIFNDNFFDALLTFVPIGIIAATFFLIINFFLTKLGNNTNLLKIRFIIIIPSLIIAAFIYLLFDSEPEGMLQNLRILLNLN